MKYTLLIAIGVLLTMLQSSCKDCYSCTNSCCMQRSSQLFFCRSDYTDEEFRGILDSLKGDVQCSYFTIQKEACSEEEKEYLKQTEGLSCNKRRKN